uniref:Uncharacterized protein n=1 Tax=Siphoviridae sp. ctETQ12 TaxID=2826206 RepID=A0A8S5M754_9CAUD|nr:MAG TPA: hypothetical protein [Siphoviridae sp. ctETQ12]DAM20702.1 MAG TPA: hypothetical protein [Caudoviricetes sp.]
MAPCRNASHVGTLREERESGTFLILVFPPYGSPL